MRHSPSHVHPNSHNLQNKPSESSQQLHSLPDRPQVGVPIPFFADPNGPNFQPPAHAHKDRPRQIQNISFLWASSVPAEDLCSQHHCNKKAHLWLVATGDSETPAPPPEIVLGEGFLMCTSESLFWRWEFKTEAINLGLNCLTALHPPRAQESIREQAGN